MGRWFIWVEWYKWEVKPYCLKNSQYFPYATLTEELFHHSVSQLTTPTKEPLGSLPERLIHRA